MKKLIIGLSAIILVMGCDKIEGPYGNSTSNNGGNNGGVAVRKVLIEDFTGHKCGNCPRAAEKLNQVHDLYGNQVISFAVHAGFFAQPDANGNYAVDFRTPEGNALNTFFGNSAAGLPNGLVNRKQFNGQSIVDYNAWPTRVAEILQTPPDLQINLTPQYENATRTFKIDASVKVLENINEATSIVYYLTEDSILGFQKDYSLTPADISQYYHRHVLRASMNGAWGTTLSDGALSQGQTIESTFTTSIPANWNENKVSVVAVIYRQSNKEVIQVEEKKIKAN